MFEEHLSPESRSEHEAWMARATALVEWEERVGGGWVARKLGCVGLGATRLEAAADLEAKVELAHGPSLTEEERARDDMKREARERRLARLGKLLG